MTTVTKMANPRTPIPVIVGTFGRFCSVPRGWSGRGESSAGGGGGWGWEHIEQERTYEEEYI